MRIFKTLMLTAVLSLSGCNYFMTGRPVDQIKGGSTPQGQGGSGLNEKLTDDELSKLQPEQITYAVVKVNVMDISCAKCHGENGFEPLVTTEDAVLANLDWIQGEVESGSMPKPRFPITAAQKKLLLDWIIKVKAAENPAPPPAEEPVPTPVEPAPVEPVPVDPLPVDPAPVQPVPAEPKYLTDEEIAALKDSEITYALVNKNSFEQSCLGCHSEAAKKPKKPLLDSYASIVDNKDMIREQVITEEMPPKGMADVRRALIIRWLDLGAPLAVSPTEVIVPQFQIK